MRWVVHVYPFRPKVLWQDGTGAQDYWREFTDEPSANRFAKNIVEVGPASFTSVERKG